MTPNALNKLKLVNYLAELSITNLCGSFKEAAEEHGRFFKSEAYVFWL